MVGVCLDDARAGGTKLIYPSRCEETRQLQLAAAAKETLMHGDQSQKVFSNRCNRFRDFALLEPYRHRHDGNAVNLVQLCNLHSASPIDYGTGCRTKYFSQAQF